MQRKRGGEETSENKGMRRAGSLNDFDRILSRSISQDTFCPSPVVKTDTRTESKTNCHHNQSERGQRSP